MIKLRLIKNPLDLKDQRIIELDYIQNQKLKDYLSGYKLGDYKIIVSGKVVTDLDSVLNEFDEIILVPKVEGPIAAIWAAIVAITKIAWVKTLFTIFAWATVAYSVVQAIIYRPRKLSTGKGDLDDSRTYGWDGITTGQDINTPIPIVYGEHRVGGNRINVFVESEPQYDWVWKTITPSNVVNSGYVNTFRTSEVRGFEFELKPLVYRISKNVGTGIPFLNLINVKGNYATILSKGYSYGTVSYKIEYKESTEEDWIFYKNTRPRIFLFSFFGIFNRTEKIQLPRLAQAQYDVRITAFIPTGVIIGIPQNQAYYQNLKGKRPISSTTEADKQYLNVLVGLCEGEIEGVSDILINENPIENFSTDGITPEVHVRKGTNDDEIIDHFGDLHNLYEIGVELEKNQPYIYTTIDSDIESFILGLSCANGLFEMKTDGSMISWSVSYKVEYRVSGVGEYINLGTFTVTKKSRSAVRFNFIKEGLGKNKYDIRITKTSADSDQWKTGDLFLIRIDEVKKDDMIYPNLAKVGMRFLAFEQLSNQMPNTTFLIKGIKVKQPKIMCEGVELDYDEYYYDNGYKRITDGAAATWDEETWVTKWSANPVWCVLDLLINKRYGLGYYIDETNLNLDLFVEMANYSDELVESGIEDGIKEKRFRMDIVLDSRQKALDWVIRLCSTFRAVGFYTEGLVKIIINKPELPSQLFGMGNIIEGSFSETFADLQDVPNSFEVEFADKNKDYKMQTYGFEDSDAIAAGDPPRLHRYSKVGVTNLSQIVRDTKYEMRCIKYLTRSIAFRAGIDAVACQVFDVIEFAHDVPQWSIKSGRVESGTNSPATITIDEPVTLEEGETYKIRIRHNIDDTFEEKTITNEAGIYTVLTVDSDWAILPADYDVYVVGIQNIVVKPFRSTNMRRLANGEVEIAALEYNEDIFADDTFKLPLDNYSMLTLEIPYVSNLALSERLVKLKDGTIENVIDVWFQKPVMIDYYLKKYNRARIYLSDNNGESWVCRGDTTAEHFIIQGDIKDGITYKVAVVSVTDVGEETTIALSPQETINVIGKSVPPSNVTNFEVCQEGNMLRFSCDPSPDVDFAFFRLKKGSNWNLGQVIAERSDLTEFMYPVGEIGSITFMAKAMDTSGNESQSPAFDVIDIVPPPDAAFVKSFDLWNRSLEYKRSADLGIEYRNLYNPDYVRKVIALRTTKTWEELELEGKTWEQAEADSDLILDKEFVTSEEIFEMVEPIDFETIFEFKVVIDVSYKNVNYGSLTVQINYSEDGTNYSGWEDINAAKQYRARYVYYRFKLQTTNTNYNIWFYGCTIFMNAPMIKIDYGGDIAVPEAGKTIKLRADFTSAPKVIITISNGVTGFIKVTKTQYDFFVRIFQDQAQTTPLGTAEIDFVARGI